ncbi:MAG: sensor histidine kinase [Gemmatimonadales bacterium]
MIASIERRLPLLVSGLLLLVVAVLSGAAYRQARLSSQAIAAERLGRAAIQLADVFQRAATAYRTQTASAAADPAVRAFVASAGRRGRTAVAAPLGRIVSATAVNEAVALWDADGRLLLFRGDSLLRAAANSAPPRAPDLPLDSARVGPLRVLADTLLHYRVHAAVHDGAAVTGWIAQIRRITVSRQSRETLNALAGGDWARLLGNAAGTPWTDLETIIPRPAVSVPDSGGSLRYERGEPMFAAGAMIRGTPWATIAEQPVSDVHAPARTFLADMALIALAVLVVGALGAWWVSRRITRPLHALTTAAERIAAGQLQQRVAEHGSDELGRLARAFNIMTEQVARSLHETQSLLRSVTQTAHDAIIAADSGGVIHYWNPAASRIFGYAAADVLGQPITLLMPARHHDAHRRGLQRYVDTREPRVVGRTVELEGRRKDGAEFPLELSLAAAPGENGGVGFTAVIRDITERKQIEEALRATNAELEAFSYSVSHDLRAPLRAIHGFARILVEEHGPQLDAEGKRLLGVIDDNTRRMGRLIDDLLAFSRLGRKALTTSRIDMRDLAGAAAEEARRGEPGRAIEISLDALPPAVGDRDLVRQALANLLQNAVKFTRPRNPARIEVGFRTERPGEIVYFVKDNGAGYDPRYAGKLFGVFQRLHPEDKFEGTGVGLAIVQRIVQRHGGRVWAEGQVDAGATFSFSLPAAEA